MAPHLLPDLPRGEIMDLSIATTGIRPRIAGRWVLFGAAVVLGASGGNAVNIEPSDWAYNSLLRLFGDPGSQIASLAMAVSLGFVLGFIHITSI
jgi:hypothetical protein